MARLGRAFPIRALFSKVPPPSGSNITLALTGVSSGVALGLLSFARSSVLTGNALTSALGTNGPGEDLALIGVAATVTLGPLASINTDRPIVGVLMQSWLGSLTPMLAVGTTGVNGTGATGAAVVGSALTGVALAAAVGNLTPNIAVPSTGVLLTTAVGTNSPSNAHPLLGASLIGGIGTITYGSTPDRTVGLTGVSTGGSGFPKFILVGGRIAIHVGGILYDLLD